MFTASLGIIPLVLAGLWWILHRNAEKYNRKDAYGRDYTGGLKTGAVVWLVFALIFVGIAGVITLVSYSKQISDSESITKYENIEEIYTARADLVKLFTRYLSVQYPDHEKELFKSMSAKDIEIYLVKYPELRAVDSIKELVSQIRTLQDDRYAQQIVRERILKDMRYRARNPWIFYTFMPEVHETR